MAAEKKPPKLDLGRQLTAIDTKDYGFYDRLTDDEKTGFTPYILMRTSANIRGSNGKLQADFILKTNDYVNKNHLDIGKEHKSLMWKLYAATGNGKTHNHQYLAAGKKEKANKIEKLLVEIYPAMKMSEIKMMASMMDKKDCTELFDSMGFDKKQRKEYE
jgi:hypothetical protein